MILKNKSYFSCDESQVGRESIDSHWMWRALGYAYRGCGTTTPNPMVGAVVVKDGELAGYGWHERAGKEHAEIVALNMAGSSAYGSTVYVTLEPCNHYGRTSPCTKALIEAGVKKIVIAMRDPNPKVKGQGVVVLQDAGIEVIVGVLEQQARELNAGWMYWVTTGKPYIVLKLALSLDGRIANEVGESKSGGLPWITGRCARAVVHKMRRWSDAVMVGANTVCLDNPILTYRNTDYRNVNDYLANNANVSEKILRAQPVKIVIDPNLNTSIDFLVYKASLNEKPVMVMCSSACSKVKKQEFRDAGIKVCEVGMNSKGKFDIALAIDVLGDFGIQSILCEGGARLGTSLMSACLVNRLILFYSARIIGSKGRPSFDTEWMNDCEINNKLSLTTVRRIGMDVMLDYKVSM